MAQLPPSAIFSPSIARQQLAAQKDWNYIDSWLSSKFNGTTPPPFERNNDTLKALLALAAHNETADEERDLLAKAEVEALQELLEKEVSNHNIRYMRALEGSLTSEGKSTLEALAQLLVSLNQPVFDTAKIARKLIDLQATTFDLEQSSARALLLEKNLRSELEQAAKLKEELEGVSYQPSADMIQEALNYQRRAKLLAAKLPEMNDSVARGLGGRGTTKVTVQDVKAEEDRYMSTTNVVKELEVQVKSYHGLPQDTGLAQLELEQLRADLGELTQSRDSMFEALVERASPRRRKISK